MKAHGAHGVQANWARSPLVGSRPGLDPRIQDVVLLAPNFTTNPYDPLFFSGKLG